MNISLDWLKSYVDVDLTAEQVADTLSDLGFPCEGMEQKGEDTVLDIEVTSNRGDCLCHIGVARELAAATGKELRMPEVEFAESDSNASDLCSVRIDNPEVCSRYTGRVIQNVKVGPTPDWMRKRIEAIGLRSVNNVVDATNYAMMECGQPAHAFDFDKIADGQIVVRTAKAGEQIVAIDGSKCTLDPNMLMIADSQKAVAIAGVMGGLDSEVSDSTTTIFLEDAAFAPVSVRTTSRKLTINSDAAFRFERFVDIEAIDYASRRTCQLICQVAGGKVAKGIVDAYPRKAEAIKVSMRVSRCNRLLGLDVKAEEAVGILSSLAFGPELDGDVVSCTVPSWRHDVSREVDLIEEVARVYGFDNVPTKKRIEIEAVGIDPRRKMLLKTGRNLNAAGFYETVNVTFVDDLTSELFKASSDGGHLAVSEDSRKSENRLRQSLIGSLLGVLKTNVNAKNENCRFYEIANTFIPSKEALPVERTKIGLVCDTELRDIRAAVEQLVHSVNAGAGVEFVPAELGWAKAGANIVAAGKTIGTAGVVSDAVRDAFDFKTVTPAGAELDFEYLSELSAAEVKVKPIPRYPAIERDLSIIVSDDTPWAEVQKAVEGQEIKLLEELRFVDIYKGKGISKGKKSVTLSLRFRDDDGTLTHEDVDEHEKVIVNSLQEKLSAEIRTAG
jgi:phenylalanyl-tRNA synthetase beta chain